MQATSSQSHSADFMVIVGTFQQLIPRLVLMNERVGKKHGLLAVEMQVLHLIALAEGPVTPSTLVALTEFPASTITRALNRLEARDLVRRSTDKTDLRKVLIEKNVAAIAPIKGEFDSFAEDMIKLTSNMSVKEQATVAKFMTGLLAIA